MAWKTIERYTILEFVYLCLSSINTKWVCSENSCKYINSTIVAVAKFSVVTIANYISTEFLNSKENILALTQILTVTFEKSKEKK